jgi:hypothetical protein
VADLSYHDRHDFAHRAREAGWSLEEVALSGHAEAGTPAVQTTVRYRPAASRSKNWLWVDKEIRIHNEPPPRTSGGQEKAGTLPSELFKTLKQ